MTAINNSFTQWAGQMVRLLEDGKLAEARWFARANAVLVSLQEYASSTH